MKLTKDMIVEVRTTEEGFEGAWFEGVILGVTTYGQQCTDGQHCKIRYDGFETEDKRPLDVELCLHSEHVQVRPVDGRLKIQLPQHCSAGYAVEASRNGGWWCGVIANLRTDVKEESWFVYFPDTDTVESYRRSELRPAQEWNGANWDLAPQTSSSVKEKASQRLWECRPYGRKRKRAVKSKVCLERVKKHVRKI